jgi:hypothetical protein
MMMIMRCLSIACVVMVTSVAAAKPLPAGMKVALVKKRVMVSRGGVSVPLHDVKYDTKKLTSAELSDDGKSIAIKTDQCDGMFGEPDEADLVPLAPVEARLENMLGMKAHRKKKYAAAVKHFSTAAQMDPDVPRYATNLLSAQSMGGMLEDADKTLATLGKQQAPWFVWRLAVDPELKALKTRPSAKLDAPKPGTAKGNLYGKLAYSPLGFAATEVYANVYDGVPSGEDEYELAIIDVRTGKEVLRLPTERTCEVDPETGEPTNKACVKKQAAATAARRKITDALLAQLGFDIVPGALVDAIDQQEIRAADGRKLLLGDTLKLVAGKTVRELPWEFEVGAAGFVPKAVVAVYKVKVPESCEGDGAWQFRLAATRTP